MWCPLRRTVESMIKLILTVVEPYKLGFEYGVGHDHMERNLQSDLSSKLSAAVLHIMVEKVLEGIYLGNFSYLKRFKSVIQRLTLSKTSPGFLRFCPTSLLKTL